MNVTVASHYDVQRVDILVNEPGALVALKLGPAEAIDLADELYIAAQRLTYNPTEVLRDEC